MCDRYNYIKGLKKQNKVRGIDSTSYFHDLVWSYNYSVRIAARM